MINLVSTWPSASGWCNAMLILNPFLWLNLSAPTAARECVLLCPKQHQFATNELHLDCREILHLDCREVLHLDCIEILYCTGTLASLAVHNKAQVHRIEKVHSTESGRRRWWVEVIVLSWWAEIRWSPLWTTSAKPSSSQHHQHHHDHHQHHHYHHHQHHPNSQAGHCGLSPKQLLLSSSSRLLGQLIVETAHSAQLMSSILESGFAVFKACADTPGSARRLWILNWKRTECE